MPSVSASIDTLTFDAVDPVRLAAFWEAALGFEVADGADDEGAYLADPSGRTRRCSSNACPKTRSPRTGYTWTCVRRARWSRRSSAFVRGSAGDEVVEIPRARSTDNRQFWTVMADPEGNEFCVLRGPGDGWVSS